MSYLLKKICFKEKSLYNFHKKLKIYKTQKTFLVGFLGVFLGFFGWVFYCQPWEQAMVNAWDGCAASAVAPVHKSAALFFYANKKTCQAWFRIRAFLFGFLDCAPLLFYSVPTFLMSL
jgi:hypothetical protein